MDRLYTRLEPDNVQRLYATMDVTPTVGIYQMLSGDSLWKADPLGLFYYVYGEGELLPEDGYDTIAYSLDLPVPYVVGFDISYEGGDVEEQITAAELDIDPRDPDLQIGSGDGTRCRMVILQGGVEV